MMSSAAGTTDLFLLPVRGIQGKLSLMPPCRLPSTVTDHFWVCLCQFLWTLPSAAGLVYVAHCLPVSTDPSTSYPKDAFFGFGFVLFVLNPSKAPLTNPDELSLEIYCYPHNGPSLPPLTTKHLVLAFGPLSALQKVFSSPTSFTQSTFACPFSSFSHGSLLQQSPKGYQLSSQTVLPFASYVSVHHSTLLPCLIIAGEGLTLCLVLFIPQHLTLPGKRRYLGTSDQYLLLKVNGR